MTDNEKTNDEIILSDSIIQTGYMSVEEMYNLVDANVRKIYGMNDGLSS